MFAFNGSFFLGNGLPQGKMFSSLPDLATTFPFGLGRQSASYGLGESFGCQMADTGCGEAIRSLDRFHRYS